MSFTMYSMAMDTFVPLLGTLSTLLDKGAEHMKAKGLKPDALAEARLAPDMFPLSKQVQIACDQAKSVAARLTGQEPPKFEDNEQTLDELKTRIRRTLDYVKSVPSSAYQGPRRQPPKVTRSDRRGSPSASRTNQRGCSRNTFEPASAMNGATQSAGSKPRLRISFSTPLTLPPKALPVSSQSPMAGW